MSRLCSGLSNNNGCAKQPTLKWSHMHQTHIHVHDLVYYTHTHTHTHTHNNQPLYSIVESKHFSASSGLPNKDIFKSWRIQSPGALCTLVQLEPEIIELLLEVFQVLRTLPLWVEVLMSMLHHLDSWSDTEKWLLCYSHIAFSTHLGVTNVVDEHPIFPNFLGGHLLLFPSTCLIVIQ